MSLIWILVPCLVTGVIFAGIAAWLTSQKGNTISDILKSEKFSDANAIKMEIVGKLKLSSNIPIVGLYLVAAAVAIGLPGTMLLQLQKGATVIRFTGIVQKDRDKKVTMVPREMRVEESGSFAIPIIYRDEANTINIESANYDPVTLTVAINKQKNTIKVTSSSLDMGEQEIEIQQQESWTAALKPPIRLRPATIPTASNVPSQGDAQLLGTSGVATRDVQLLNPGISAK